jgi:hypothetical protein
MIGETHPWTVYHKGEPVAIATDEELMEILSLLSTVYVDYRTCIIEIVE